MREIPLNGRHWASLMALAPGAINTGEGNQQPIRFVGRARDDNNWTFDGLDATGVKDPRQEAALRLVISTDSMQASMGIRNRQARPVERRRCRAGKPPAGRSTGREFRQQRVGPPLHGDSPPESSQSRLVWVRRPI
jgi:hypothetical protein